MKQLDESKKFQEYKTWRQHVEKLLEKCDAYELEEFYRFAKSNARICDNDMGMHVYLALPLGASVVWESVALFRYIWFSYLHHFLRHSLAFNVLFE